MVYRIYVEKKPALALEADALAQDCRALLGIPALTRVRVLNRYDVEGIDKALFDYAVRAVLSEPQLDNVCFEPELDGAQVFAVEYLPGQFDQRSDSAAQCIQFLSGGERPAVRSAKVYALYGNLSGHELAEIKRYVINPVEAREACLDKPETLAAAYAQPEDVAALDGFLELSRDALEALAARMGLAMDVDDLAFCQRHFREQERRCPTVTELRVLDTYWSDHCRHTTFHTVLDSVTFEDKLLQDAWEHYLDARRALGRTAPVCLMDLGTIAARALRAQGKLDKLDVSEEINACTVKTEITVDGVREPWLLLFKNETHNHPTEIEPFGGAATCIGGAIRDPLSGRGYVYGAMRLSGAADPRKGLSETLPGKLPQRRLVTAAAAGYSSYGNQIGLATGIVDELYHPGYAAKHLELGAVIAAAPARNVRRERPQPGDAVLLLGGSTGRDGIGGATGSSKAHNAHSVETCGAEVQKGNAPEERKLQRLFRSAEACRMIKRCNDFGAGGVSVAIGELADGLAIELDAVPKKYEGLDGTELAISESQERMAVVVAPEDVERFLALAREENLQACRVATVTAEPRLVMRWRGKTIVDLSRAFLDTNGAEKHTAAAPAAAQSWEDAPAAGGFAERCLAMASSLACCSRQGLSERFDSTVGAGTVLLPFGGKNQLTPIQAMVHRFPVERGETDDCSLMAWGFDPEVSARSPYHGAYLAVAESVSKLIASGADRNDVYLSFQEYFEKLGRDPKRWGKPLAALLGAFEAQMGLGVAAIGGKDSMSGSFEDLDVPPTLVSFAVTTQKVSSIVSPEFKAAGHRVIHIAPRRNEYGLPDCDSLLSVFDRVASLLQDGRAVACYTPGPGGIAEAVMKMCFGNGVGFRFDPAFDVSRLFTRDYGAFLLELSETGGAEAEGETVGYTTEEAALACAGETLPLERLLKAYQGTLEPVYPTQPSAPAKKPETLSFHAAAPAPKGPRTAVPRFLIPVFPGTNCEYDSARAVRAAGGEAEIFIVNNLDADAVSRSVERFAAALSRAQAVFLPGGFSGGDEPDGSAKFITAFFRSAAVRAGVEDLLDRRGGLMCGVCNGFQALIKLGLVPYGKITDTDEESPTLAVNVIGRHQSRIVRTRVVSTLSPWLSLAQVGEVYSVPISHGEGRLLASESLVRSLAEGGQVATQYVDLNGEASADVRFNPNGSVLAVEGITSPDGRVFGKMGHTERVGAGLYRNVPGNYDLPMFASAVRYFRG
ncbi:MAG: phosphoribosylformylglycinamidine synthase [Ruminococcaceae bacterium]|jgi:phosphoribosylformylglycinamidine synthase|nr:phosphoribosylformylglycinamidine synthase [Oscillospiraceae bacterium]